MTLPRIILTLAVLLAGAPLAFADGSDHHRSAYEVWTVDQSNSASKATGGTLYVYDPKRLESPERIDLGGAAETLCLQETGTAPVRPHMVLFNRSRSHSG